jgi:hypothetical protein
MSAMPGAFISEAVHKGTKKDTKGANEHMFSFVFFAPL